MEIKGKYQPKIIRPCKWTFEKKTSLQFVSRSLGNQILLFIIFYCYNQPLTKVVSIGWCRSEINRNNIAIYNIAFVNSER